MLIFFVNGNLSCIMLPKVKVRINKIFVISKPGLNLTINEEIKIINNFTKILGKNAIVIIAITRTRFPRLIRNDKNISQFLNINKWPNRCFF